MGKIRRFLGILTIFATVCLGTNAFGAGYDCPNSIKYTSCNEGYYLSDCGTQLNELLNSVGTTITTPTVKNSCVTCPEGWICTSGNSCPTQRCNKITIDGNGGTVTPSVLYKKTGQNGWYKDPECTTSMLLSGGFSATATDKIFSGLYSSKAVVGGTQLFDGDGSNTGATWLVTDDATIYARWDECAAGYHVYNNECTANTYTVLFHSNDNSTSAATKRQSFTYGVAQELSANTFTRTGYTFQGWATSSTATTATYSNAQSVENLSETNGATVNLYAVWKANTYTVVFNSNSGATNSATKRQSFTYDVAQNLSANTFTRTGYTFQGWGTSSTATTATYSNEQSVKNLSETNGAIVNLYAVWGANTYSVKFYANGGSGTMADQTFTYDVAQNLSANAFTRTGYVFQGWATSSTATTATYSNEQSVKNLADGGTTHYDLYAVWGACTAGYYCPAGSTSVTQNKCPANWTSDAGAGAQSDCKREIILDSNGLTWADTNTTEQKKVWVNYNVSYVLPTPSAFIEPDGIYPTGSWSTTKPAKIGASSPNYYKSIKYTGTDEKTPTLYALRAGADVTITISPADPYSGTSLEIQCLAFGGDCILPEMPWAAVSGYNFVGWEMVVNTCNSDLADDGTIYAPGEDVSDLFICPGNADYEMVFAPLSTQAACPDEGQYFENGTCKTCEPGSYCPDKYSKKDCPYSMESDAGATSFEDCYFAVTQGNYWNNDDKVILPCLPGYYCPNNYKVTYNTYRNDGPTLDDLKADGSIVACAYSMSWPFLLSDAGAYAKAQCYAGIKVNKNGGSGTVSIMDMLLNYSGAEESKYMTYVSGTDDGLLKCYSGYPCAMPGLDDSGLTQTGYQFYPSWGVNSDCSGEGEFNAEEEYDTFDITNAIDDEYYNTGLGQVYYPLDGGGPYDWDDDSVGTIGTLYACKSKASIACAAGSYLPANSTSAADCTPCDAGSYCPGGTDFTQNNSEAQGIYSCSTVGSGEYTLSDSGAQTADECYKTEETACYDPCEGERYCKICPNKNFLSCAYDTTAKTTVKLYPTGSSEGGDDNTCPVLYNTYTKCSSGMYLTSDVNDCSEKCSSLEGVCPNASGGTETCWSSSINANMSAGASACYGAGCTPTCNLSHDYVLGADGKLTGEYVNHCPEHATCTENSTAGNGFRWYPNTICTPTTFCSFTYTCDAGYVASTTGDIEYGYSRTLYGAPKTATTIASCDPGVWEVTLDANGGTGGTTTIWEKYTVGWYSDENAENALSTIQIPTRANYAFLGYFKGDIKVIDENGKPNTDEVALFTSDGGVITAEWERLQKECFAGYDVNQNACQPGYYCPGGWVDAGTETDTTLGCMRLCPTDASNGKVSSASGSNAKTDCYTVRPNIELGDKTGAGDQTCYYGTSLYDANCNIRITSCIAGRYREAENSQTCALVGIGAYSVEGSIEQMLCAKLKGANETTTTSVDNASTPTQCYNTCSNIRIENGLHVPEQKSVYYNNTDIPECKYTTECDTGYSALGEVCYPKVFTITLDKGAEDATQELNTIYLKYNDGWYLKSTVGANGQADATDKIESIEVPERINYSFGGYVASNGAVVINPDGSLSSNYTIFTENAMLTAVWGENPIIKCDKGMYYDGSEDACVVCPNGAYCGGVTTHQNGDKIDKGIEYCENLNGTYVEAIDQNGRPVEVSVSSAKGSDEKADCYATNVQYVSSTNRASGSQTCYYDEATNSYSVSCVDISILYCVAGHWLESAVDTDCAEVGYGYYSAAKSLGRVACPNLGEVDNVTTQSTTSEKVTQCYLGDRWLETQNGAQRLSCYHIDDASETDVVKGYSYQCAMPVIVACNAGYYDDGVFVNENGTRDCAQVGQNYYSPEQKFFTDEPEQPLSAKPGSSTKRTLCPFGGKNDTTTAGRASMCYKEKLSCEITNGEGENKCNYDDTKEAYALDCTTCIVTSCDENFSQVGNACIGCPEDNVCSGGEQKTCAELTGGAYIYADAGTTDVAYCYADCTLGQNATGMTGRDYYGDNVADTCQIAMCASGYYLNNGACVLCPEGYVCETGGQNDTPKTCLELTGGKYGYADAGTTDVAYCYADCTLAQNAAGMTGRDYYGDNVADTCQIAMCASGYYLNNGVCVLCPEGYVCETGGQNDTPKTCLELTGGAYIYADAGTTDVAYCYADCDFGENATQMSGRNYYGDEIVDTCQVTACEAGYYLNNSQCAICPAGNICTTDTPGNTPQTCAELTGGLYTLAAPGSSSIKACYMECKEYAVTNGTAVPVEDTAFYPFECEFEGRSPTGNPCDIIDNVCIETSCNYNFELIDGICTPCARENAISYKQGGNCVVESCVSGYHPNGQACESNVIECSAPNAIAATQKWDSNKNAFSECIITECADGYHLGSNACQVDEQVCELENGIGVREWNHNTNTWGECIATECNPGYTNDSSLTNEGWKQCGRCNNMYSANGELAASSYVRGCEIASCMYQGELYNLEDNECRLICDTYSDETGSRKWNASRKKCEHTCAPGYTTW